MRNNNLLKQICLVIPEVAIQVTKEEDIQVVKEGIQQEGPEHHHTRVKVGTLLAHRVVGILVLITLKEGILDFKEATQEPNRVDILLEDPVLVDLLVGRWVDIQEDKVDMQNLKYK